MSANKANYTTIGLTVVVGTLAIIGTLVYLGGAGSREERVYAETFSDKSVSGLSVGSAVNFRGVKVGEVAEISFVGNKYEGVTPMDARRIYILMSFRKEDLGFYVGKADQLVRSGMRATVTPSGITGLSRIELDIVGAGAPAYVPPWNTEHTYIPSAVSLLASFSDSATKVMDQINKIDIAAAWSNIQSSVASFATAADGVATTIDSCRGDIEQMLNDFTETASSLKTTASELMHNPSLLVRERVPAPLDETERE